MRCIHISCCLQNLDGNALPLEQIHLQDKSSVVMKERRKSAKRLLGTKTAHATRLRLMAEANKAFMPQPMIVDTDLPMPMDMSALTEPMMAARTKPKVPAKYKQRMGAKKAKHIE